MLSRVADKPDKDLVTASPNAQSTIHGYAYEAPSRQRGRVYL